MNDATKRQPMPKGTGREITPLVIDDLARASRVFIPTEVTSDLLRYEMLIEIARELLKNNWTDPNYDRLVSDKVVTEQLIVDLLARSKMGVTRYGEALRAFNGRDAALDLYQEILDAIVYARQVVEETVR